MIVARPRLLDAYCCAGGASVGYSRAGFDVEGVELYPRADYPFRQHRGDAVAFIREHGHEYAVRVASPPCQKHTTLTKGHLAQGRDYGHVDHIADTRDALLEVGGPYIIENVVGARTELRDPIMLCGLSFGLRVFRHRLFESNVPLLAPPHPSHRGHRVAGWRHGIKHDGDMFAVYGDGGGKGTTAEWQAAMGIDWTEDRQAIAEAHPTRLHRAPRKTAAQTSARGDRMTTETLPKPLLSGWCSAPAGAKPAHPSCRWDLCQCLCHHSSKGGT